MRINPEVDRFLAKKKHPLTEGINAIKKIILETNDRIEEAIKFIRMQDGS